MKFNELVSPSLVELFVQEIEGMIFSGELKAGEKLPPERELAKQLNVSQTVINTGCAILAGKGLLQIIPRKGTFVIDYHTLGGFESLSALVEYSQKTLPPSIMPHMYEFRYAVEQAFFSKVTLIRTEDQLGEFKLLLEKILTSSSSEEKSEYGFQLIKSVCKASENPVFMMIINGFQELYYKVFHLVYNGENYIEYEQLLQALVKAIEDQNIDEVLSNVNRIEKWDQQYLNTLEQKMP